MSEYGKKLHYMKNGAVKDISLYTTREETSVPALCIKDGNETVFAQLDDVSDEYASDLRVLHYGKTYAVCHIAKRIPTITTSVDSMSIAPSQSETFTVSTDSNGTMTITSSNTGVAKLTRNGAVVTVTAVSDGTTTINISVASTDEYKARAKTIQVTVAKKTATITTSTSSVLFSKGNETEEVIVSCDGNGSLSATSSNTDVATVSFNRNKTELYIKSDRHGSATVTITSSATSQYYAATKTITVKVQKPTANMYLNPTSVKLNSANGYEAMVDITTDYDGPLTATTSASNISCGVNSDKTVTIYGYSNGSGTVTVKAQPGWEETDNYLTVYTRTCSVTVRDL